MERCQIKTNSVVTCTDPPRKALAPTVSTCSLKLYFDLTDGILPTEEFGEVSFPQVIHIGPLEQSDAFLISTKSLLKVIVFLKKQPVVYYYLWRCYFQVDDSVVHGFAGLKYI